MLLSSLSTSLAFALGYLALGQSVAPDTPITLGVGLIVIGVVWRAAWMLGDISRRLTTIEQYVTEQRVKDGQEAKDKSDRLFRRHGER